jgi:hypothetical protein
LPGLIREAAPRLHLRAKGNPCHGRRPTQPMHQRSNFRTTRSLDDRPYPVRVRGGKIGNMAGNKSFLTTVPTTKCPFSVASSASASLIGLESLNLTAAFLERPNRRTRQGWPNGGHCESVVALPAEPSSQGASTNGCYPGYMREPHLACTSETKVIPVAGGDQRSPCTRDRTSSLS